MTAGEASGWITQIRTWQDAENNAASWMRHWGFHDARAALGGPDGGVDVRASGALAQVKFRAAQVGRPDLQRLVGARGNSTAQLLFFTGTGYSKRAIEFADEMGIGLFTYALNGVMSPVNARARIVVAPPPPMPDVYPVANPRYDTYQVYQPYEHQAYQPYEDRSRHPFRNWRALVGYVVLFLLIGTLARPSNYSTGADVAGVVLGGIIELGIAAAFLNAHRNSRYGTWPPRPRR